MPARNANGTATKILDAAERMVQVRGFNAFSYADIAETLGIRKASLHHHYATKADLGLALLARYRTSFLSALDTIAAESDDAQERLQRYAALYRSVLLRKRMCLCGMLAADAATLPREMREGVAEFFAENEQWLSAVLDDGRKRGRLTFTGTSHSLATFIVSSLEGAMLVSRGGGNPDHFDHAAKRLIDLVSEPGRSAAPARKSAARTPRS